MTVYVESNFVLEIALGQEQASDAETILESAEMNEISLAIPWLSLSEPFSTVTKRSRDRQQFIGQMERQLRDLRRSQKLAIDVQPLELGPTLLAQVDSDDTENLIRAAERILDAATVLSVDAPNFRRAMGYRTRFGFSPQDALVYASVVDHLANNAPSGPHYFVTKDRDDFRNPRIGLELRGLGCELLLSFPAMAVLLVEPSND